MKCTKDPSGMMRVGNADYIIVTGIKESTGTVRELHRRKYVELLERYKIREGTCAAPFISEDRFSVY